MQSRVARKSAARPTRIAVAACGKMRKGAALAALAMVGALGACSGNVNETAATITYNARYVGPATLSGAATPTPGLTVPLSATLSMSQLASTVTGTIAVTGTNGTVQDTVLSAAVMGHTTPSGIDITIVQPAGCATHFSGPLTLQADGTLSGALPGSDCNANGQNDLQLTLSLARQ